MLRLTALVFALLIAGTGLFAGVTPCQRALKIAQDALNRDPHHIQAAEQYLKAVDNWLARIDMDPRAIFLVYSNEATAHLPALRQQYLEARQILDKIIEWQDLKNELSDAADMIAANTAIQDLRSQFVERAKRLEQSLINETHELPDSIIVEISVHSAVRDETAWEHLLSLVQMYQRFAKQNSAWKFEILDDSPRHFQIAISGPKVGQYFEHEEGIHRFEYNSGRRPSTEEFMVNVLPDRSQSSVNFPEADFHVETTTSRGPGGQHVNKTETAVRLTHIPTGESVYIQESRSQATNKERAFRILRARLEELEKKKQAVDRQQIIRTQNAERQRIRTYDLIEHRLTDHRTNARYNVETILESGELAPIIEGVQLEVIAERLRRRAEDLPRN